jgi:hypothetical protein
MPAAEENLTGWFVLRGRALGGPYPYSFVREGARGGLISRYDLIWRPGWEDWCDAGGMGGLVFATEIHGDAQPLKPNDRSSVLPVAPTFSFAPPSDADAGELSPNYVMGHWRGEFSLAAALWGNGLILGLVLVIAASAFYTVLDQTKMSVVQFAITAIALLVLCLASTIWFLVGLWRSAARHKSRGAAGQVLSQVVKTSGDKSG